MKWTSSLPLLSVTSAGNEVNQFIFPTAVKQIEAPVSDKLTLAVANGETYISSLSIGELGLQMFYGAPKTLVAKHYVTPGSALASNVQPRQVAAGCCITHHEHRSTPERQAEQSLPLFLCGVAWVSLLRRLTSYEDHELYGLNFRTD